MMPPKKKKRKLVKAAVFFGSILLLAILLRIFVFEVYAVNKNSMMNTLLDGDKVFVNKLQRKKVKRNDVVVFHMNGETMIKRCIALPGDEVKIIHDSIFVNNRYEHFPAASLVKHIDDDRVGDFRIASPEIYDLFGHAWRLDSFGPYTVPYRGMSISPAQKKLYTSIRAAEQDTGVEITGSYIIKNNYLFFVGDNRRHSTDSRNYGPVPAAQVIGIARFIFYSKKKFFSGKRFLKSIS